MKNIKFLIGLFITQSFLACSYDYFDYQIDNTRNVKSILTGMEIKSLFPDEIVEMSENQVLSIVENFQGILQSEGQLETRNNSKVIIQVKDKKILHKNLPACTRDEDSNSLDISIYEVEIIDGENKAIAFVSGDLRVPKVIAYIPVENGDSIKIDGIALEAAKTYLLDEIESFVNAKAKYPETLEKISNGLGISKESVDIQSIRDYIAIYGKEDETEHFISRSTPQEQPGSNILYAYPRINTSLCDVRWHHNAPFNDLLPEDFVIKFSDWAERDHYNAGSATVAIAQIFAALQPPMTYLGRSVDWSYLKENREIIAPDYFNVGDPLEKRTMVATVFREIYDKIKAYPVYTQGRYFVDGWNFMNVQAVADVQASLANIYSYLNGGSGMTRCSSSRIWNAQVIMESIMNYKPVYAKVGNHDFVIDGFFVCQRTYSSSVSVRAESYTQLINSYDCYWHANLGWGIYSGTGYYLIGRDGKITFQTEVGNYLDNQITVIPDIWTII